MPKYKYYWDKKAGQYRRSDGRFVPRSEVRRAIDEALEAEKKAGRNLVLSLRNGNISLTQWYQEMRDTIKNVHLYSGAAARGGWAQLTQSDYGRIGRIIQSEYQFLARKVAGVVDETVPLDGRFMSSALQYIEAGRDSFFQIERVVMSETGYTEERNIRTAKESCSGCIEQSDLGWQKIGSLIPIGRRNCLRNCRCHLDYRK